MSTNEELVQRAETVAQQVAQNKTEIEAMVRKLDEVQAPSIASSKEDIRQAIIEKGQEVDTSVPFSEYGNKIRKIEVSENIPESIPSITDNVVTIPVGKISENKEITVGTAKAAKTYTPSTKNQTIAKDTYLTGVQTIKGDANLIAQNIKSGVSIFSVSGTFTSDATASSSDIASGKTAYVNGAKVTGTATGGGGGETFYKCTAVFGPSSITFLTVTGAGADCNGRYDDSGMKKNGNPVYQFTNTSGQQWYIYFFEDEYEGNYWLISDNMNVDYPYGAYYFSSNLTSGWQNGDYGEGESPSVTQDSEIINAEQPKTWNGIKAEFDGAKFVFSTEVTEELSYNQRKPVIGGIYTNNVYISADFLYTGFPEISCPVNPDANTYGDWVMSASSTLDEARSPYKAFTEAASNASADGWHSISEQQSWIEWENTIEPVLVSRYSLLFRSDTVSTEFQLQGSNDGVDWVTLDIVDNSANLSEVERVIVNTTAFTRHRIVFLRKSGDYVMVYRITAKSI